MRLLKFLPLSIDKIVRLPLMLRTRCVSADPMYLRTRCICRRDVSADAMYRVPTGGVIYWIFMPEKPMNAIARIPAQMSAIGTPFMARGRGISSSCSLIPANIHSARVNPRDVANP